MTDVIVWTKPACVQCRLVKARLDAAAVPYLEEDITSEANAKDLEYFRGLGFTSVPITEYGGIIAFPGFMPAEVDRVIAAWRADHPERTGADAEGARRLADNEARRIPGKTLAESLGIEVPESAPGGQKLGGVLPGQGHAGKVTRPDVDAEYDGFPDVDGWRK